METVWLLRGTRLEEGEVATVVADVGRRVPEWEMQYCYWHGCALPLLGQACYPRTVPHCGHSKLPFVLLRLALRDGLPCLFVLACMPMVHVMISVEGYKLKFELAPFVRVHAYAAAVVVVV